MGPTERRGPANAAGERPDGRRSAKRCRGGAALPGSPLVEHGADRVLDAAPLPLRRPVIGRYGAGEAVAHIALGIPLTVDHESRDGQNIFDLAHGTPPDGTRFAPNESWAAAGSLPDGRRADRSIGTHAAARRTRR